MSLLDLLQNAVLALPPSCTHLPLPLFKSRSDALSVPTPKTFLLCPFLSFPISRKEEEGFPHKIPTKNFLYYSGVFRQFGQ